MRNKYEDDESCNAFNLLFYQIKLLQISEKSLKHQNTKALVKCKNEIKNLFATAVGQDEEEESAEKVS